MENITLHLYHKSFVPSKKPMSIRPIIDLVFKHGEYAIVMDVSNN